MLNKFGIKKRTVSAVTALFVAGLMLGSTMLTGASQASFAAEKSVITVSAAASLKEPLDVIKAKYEKTHPGVTVRINYGSSGSLQTQIENGAPADLFVSAGKKQVDGLASKGLINEKSRVDLLSNKLVLITASSNKTVKSYKDLLGSGVKKLALGEPASTPAGKYAEEAMKSLGLLDQLKPKMVYAKNVKEVLTWVETKNADAGFVYYSDAKSSKKSRIIEAVNPKLFSKIVYPAAVIKNSKNAAGGNNFLYTLKGKDSKAVFEKYGFIYTLK